MNAVVKEVVVEQTFAARIWQTLSHIDCSKHVEKKQNLTYLSWAWAWAILMENFPESDFAFDEPREFPDGTYEIWVAVVVREGAESQLRRMWLPVLDYKNQPLKNPTAFQINTTRMRCLTKCLAMFGLGHYIYAGEDVPRPELDAPAVGEKQGEFVTAEQAAELKELLRETNSDTLAFLNAMGGAASVDELPGSIYQRAMMALNKKLANQRSKNAT